MHFLLYYIDDPSVLVEAETDFLIQMFGNENQEVTVDKENMPPTTLTTGKETQGNNTKATSVSSKPKARPKEVRKRMKSKELSDQSKAKRPKKVCLCLNSFQNPNSIIWYVTLGACNHKVSTDFWLN